MVRTRRKLGLLIRSLKRAIGPTNPPQQVSRMPLSVPKAIRNLLINLEVADKIKNRYFEDRFVVLAAIPKSSSSVIGPCSRAILSARRNDSDFPYLTLDADIDLRPDLVRHTLWGGIVKSHIRANSTNLDVIRLLGAKHMILVRHPADQLTAVYCQTLRSIKDSGAEVTFPNNGFMARPYYPIHQSSFDRGLDPNTSLSHMIRHGYLYSTLNWMVDWLRLRNSAESIVIRYEDFMTDKLKVFRSISQLICGTDLDELTVNRCNSISDGYASRSHVGNPSYYPYGWSGKVGIWKNYFSNENIQEYRAQVSHFIDTNPGASLLLNIYPNLVDIEHQ